MGVSGTWRRRLLGVGAVVAASALLLTGCMGSAADTSASDSAAGGGEANLAMATEPPNIDPILMRNIGSWNMYYAIFDGLTRIAGDGSIQPGLAEEWTSNDAMDQWDFTIREGVTFHDGSELKPSDIVYTYQKILSSETSTNKVAIAMVQNVEVVDGDVVRFTLKNPFSAWLNQVATIGIVPEAVYEELGDGFAEAPVGTGPYKFVSWKHGVDYTIEKNEDYWGEGGTLDKVTFTFVGADDARVTGVESGTLDAATIPSNQVAVLEGSPQAQVIEADSNKVGFLGINTTAGPLQNVDLRRAISLAIDRDTIVKQLVSGLGTPTGQLVAEGVNGYVPDIAVPEFDAKQAEKLIEGSGYAGEEITLQYTSTGGEPLSTEIAQAIAGYLQDVGLNIKLVGAEQSSQSLTIANHQITGLYLNFWSPSSMDGDVVVSQLLAGGPEDYARDPEMAALYQEQQAAPEGEREKVFQEIWERNADLVYQVPLYAAKNTYAANPELAWSPAVDGIYRVQEIAWKQ